jgi:LuxR family maltose regulon positive regulatory protein
MTAGAGTGQSTRTRRPGRIIERPRLIKLLDDADAPVILIVAPAGYGKTTLARQWARRLSGVIWLTVTRSHRDVSTFAEDFASAIDRLGGEAGQFVSEYVRARSNPQRAADEVAQVLAGRLAESPAQWVIVDDYQEIEGSPAEAIVSVLRERSSTRIVVSSRARPTWLAARDLLYGHVTEVGVDQLSLTPAEAKEILGARQDLNGLIEQAQGWPAVISLAAGLDPASARRPLHAELHDYVAEELFQSASPELQRDLLELALYPPGKGTFAPSAERALELEQARRLGFIGSEQTSELHPLLREFLLVKLLEAPDADERIRSAIQAAVEAEAWDSAFDLVLRFQVSDLVPYAVQSAFKPLVRKGRLGTLSSFAEQMKNAPGFPPPAVDVIDAEVALRDGQIELASNLCDRAIRRLPSDHPLLSRSHAILAQSFMFGADYRGACEAFTNARRTARDEADETEALHGMCVSKIYGELEDASEELKALRQRRHLSPLHLLRYSTAAVTARRYQAGLGGDLGLSEPLSAIRGAEDPRVRSSFAYTAANSLILRCDYREATMFAKLLATDVSEYKLEFVLPFLAWTQACIAIGLRRYGEADRQLQIIEEAALDHQQRHHAMNACVLRARLLLHAGKPNDAVSCLSAPPTTWRVPKAWVAEYSATRALSLALAGGVREAEEVAIEAEEMSQDFAARVTAITVRAVIDAADPQATAIDDMLAAGQASDVWDPVLQALRLSPALSSAMASASSRRDVLLRLSRRADDQLLARTIGVRERAIREPDEVLSRRELEVLGLIAQGNRNKEIAEALFIAESTVKVHVRHILEKLGVRTRAQAVVRYERLQAKR